MICGNVVECRACVKLGSRWTGGCEIQVEQRTWGVIVPPSEDKEVWFGELFGEDTPSGAEGSPSGAKETGIS